MTDCLIHIHVYYPEIWKELALLVSSLRKIKYDLFVTYVGEQPDLCAAVLREFPDARLIRVSNEGYDIAPFVKVLNTVKLEDYNFVIKLHTKRDLPKGSALNGWDISGSRWRDALLKFMKNDNLMQCLFAFSSNPKLGMVSHHTLIFNNEPADDRAWNSGRELLEKAGLKEGKSAFVGGTMFVCRAELMEPVRKVLRPMQFEVPNRSVPSSLSHACERFIGMCVTAQGYTIEDVFTDSKTKRKERMWGITQYAMKKILRFFYQNKTTTSGVRLIKFCKIPIYRRKLLKK